MPTTPTRKMVRSSVLATVGLLGWSLAEYVRVRQGARGARWLARDLNALDRAGRQALRWSRPDRADRLADLLAYGASPALCAWALRRRDEPLVRVVARDGFAVTGSAVAAGVVNQLAKHWAMRERPCADGVSRRVKVPDRYGSFFSGHTSSVAVICAATAFRRVCQGLGSRRLWALPVLPLLTGYLRVAADKHYVSDVLVGLSVGVAVAVASTWLELGVGARPAALPVVAEAPAFG